MTYIITAITMFFATLPGGDAATDRHLRAMCNDETHVQVLCEASQWDNIMAATKTAEVYGPHLPKIARR